MRIFRFSISMTLIAGALTAGCTRSGDSPQTPSQLTTQTVASGAFIAERTVTAEEMQEILAFESEDGSKTFEKPAVGWKMKTITTNVDSTLRTVTQVRESELIEFQADRAIYRISSSETDSAGYSLTNQIWIGAEAQYINGSQVPAVEVSKTAGIETGDPKIKETQSPGNLFCRTTRSKKNVPSVIEMGKYRFSDGTVLPVTFRVQENRTVRFICGEQQDLERRGTSESVSIVGPNKLSVFLGYKSRLDNGIFVGSRVQETLIFRDIRRK